jgi:MFS superfamily sulfate permease-like transporter
VGHSPGARFVSTSPNAPK